MELDELRPTESGPDLVMYCRSWCGDCARAKAWLNSRGIPYLEVDVEADPDAGARAAAHNNGRLHTPTFEYGTEVCVDFDQDRLCFLLGIEP